MSLWTHIPGAFSTLAATGVDAGVVDIEMGRPLFLLIPALPALAALLCGLYWALGVKSKFPAWTTVAALAGSFAVTLVAYFEIAAPGLTHVVHGFRWINIAFGAAGGERMLFVADFSLYIDSLTVLWMLFVTGLATLIALYASEYMSDDVGPGYCRFFFAFSLFVVAMACLVMGDNLLMLFLGWEGVGLCSYLLIGYFFKKPSAVNAAKKAFVMNRIGDLGLMIGIMLAFLHFGSLRYEEIFAQVAILQQDGGDLAWTIKAIPYLLLVGAIGKSAQLPLFTWLPDAMEGPTPVSALIHAATMVTAGVYLVARMYPIFLLTPESLTLVAWIGGLTALVAATIGMAQYDIKRIMAYSTVSQLGFMFLGLGVLTSVGAAFHVFTHAFFKAALFLCCGAVMHGFAGQLDLRKLSGVQFMKGWGIVGVAMFVGCINLAGLPFTAGFFSKDMILAEAFTTPGFTALGVIALLTAGITAYYTFRVYFRVFLGPQHFEPGDELHGHDEHDHDDSHGDDGEAKTHDDGHAHDFHPHPPGWAINTVLVVLAVGSILAALAYVFPRETGGWVKGLISTSSAAGAAHHDHEASFFGLGDPHKVMYYVSGVIALVGIAIAWWLHLAGRTTAATSRADAIKQKIGPVGRWAERKWYFDEIYDFLFRYPLLIFSHIFYLFDKLVIDGLVDLFGRSPRSVGAGVRPTQSGGLQNYAMGMAGGLAFIIVVAWLVVWRMSS
ncbi:MAG: NADH-quinone oxidoreductase subunit L [Phycisphaeraceae bacterium]|nr:MAG: NADH-quinone oxidoreductase subunit L [Phycisphaeraceae bacterium]